MNRPAINGEGVGDMRVGASLVFQEMRDHLLRPSEMPTEPRQGRQRLAQSASTGKMSSYRPAPERGEREGAETHSVKQDPLFPPVPGLAPFLLFPWLTPWASIFRPDGLMRYQPSASTSMSPHSLSFTPSAAPPSGPRAWPGAPASNWPAPPPP